MSMSDFQKRRWMQSLSRMHNGEMMFPNLQLEIATWARETFPNTPEPTVFNKLVAEVKEMDMARHRYWIDSGRGDNPEAADSQEVADEAADVLMMLFQIAEVFEFDLLERTREKFEVNKHRSWEKQPDGTYQHVAN